MAKLAIPALCLGAAAMVGAIALELRPSRKDPAAAPPAMPAAASPTPIARPTLFADQDKASLDTALARPLFAATRRPVVAARVARAGPAGAKLPRLAGIMVDGQRRSVIFAPEGDRKPITVAEGGEIDGFRVERIEGGAVTVSGPGMHQVVRPSFNPNAAPPPAPVAAMPAMAPGQLPGQAFNGPPGLTQMPAIVSAGTGPVTPTIPGLPSLSNMTGIPGLAPQDPERR